MSKDLDNLCIDTIRTLSMDAVQQAKSGHPGTPMALAPVVYTLWNRVMRFDPKDPIWPNRDRFILSNGHASMLLWSVLHLTETRAVNSEYERLGAPAVTLDDIRRFRQLDSKAPGHPEYRWVTGVESTTGPLGQGVATSVGMAIGQKWLAHRYNLPGFEIFKLSHLLPVRRRLPHGRRGLRSGIAGRASPARQSMLDLRQQSHHHRGQYAPGVHRRRGHALSSVTDGTCFASATRTTSSVSRNAFRTFHGTRGRPTLIIVDSHIGYGSPNKQDTAAAHGEPLGEDEIRLIKRNYGWPEDAKFLVPDAVKEHFAAGVGARGAKAAREWIEMFAAYEIEHPELAREIELIQRRELPPNWNLNLPVFAADGNGVAGRDASGKVLNVLAQNIPWFFRWLGGSRAVE